MVNESAPARASISRLRRSRTPPNVLYTRSRQVAIKSGGHRKIEAWKHGIYDFDLSRVKLNHRYDRYARVDPHRCGIGAGVASRCGYASGVLRSTFTCACTVCVCVYVCTHVHMYGEPRSRRLLYLIDDLSRCLLPAERYPSARHEEATWDRLIKSFRVASEVVGFIWQRCRTIACPIPVIILLFSPPSSRPVSFSRARSFVYGKCARRLDLVCSKNKTLDKRFVVSSSTGRENFFPSLRILSASCSEKRW